MSKEVKEHIKTDVKDNNFNQLMLPNPYRNEVNGHDNKIWDDLNCQAVAIPEENDQEQLGNNSFRQGSEQEEFSKTGRDNRRENVDNQNLLPDNWTDQPQDDEHIDFTRIQQYDPEFKGRLYLPVSDDQGEKLGDVELERTVKEWCQYLDNTEDDHLENPEEILNQISHVCGRYINAVNLTDNIGKGIQAKYNIRLGKLMIEQKKLVKKANKKWRDFFDENYSSKMSIRSAQVYMNLAKIPNIIRYAVFGQERLRNIVKFMGREYDSSEDPIADFLRDHNFTFYPTEESNDDELRIQADLVLAKKKLLDAGISDVPADKLNAFVRLVRYITTSHLIQLRSLLDAGFEINEAMDRLIARRGKISVVERRPHAFKRKVEEFISRLDSAIANDAYLQELDAASVQQLKAKVEALEAKLSATSDN